MGRTFTKQFPQRIMVFLRSVPVPETLYIRDRIPAVVPVKLSTRLPGKHFLKLGSKPILEIIVEKLKTVAEVSIYSKVHLDFPHELELSPDIMHLVSLLSQKFNAFILVAGDMPFFTVEDLEILIRSFSGRTVVPRDSDGSLQPLFAIYSGKMSPGRNLAEMISSANHQYIDSSIFSKYAFFNVNTHEDYIKAIRIWDELHQQGN